MQFLNERIIFRYGKMLGISPGRFLWIFIIRVTTIQKIICECNFSMREYYFGMLGISSERVLWIFLMLRCTIRVTTIQKNYLWMHLVMVTSTGNFFHYKQVIRVVAKQKNFVNAFLTNRKFLAFLKKSIDMAKQRLRD